ncbi:MAG TPA: restriction endonuclease [Burkholderiaceae bacterium]|nr:restriction endonuclease [Burkholderiaceae bacterium]
MNKSSRVTDTTDESITPFTYPSHSQHAEPDRVAHAFESAYRHERSAAAKRTKPTIWSVDVLHDIEWRRFEALVESYFAQIGFATRSQSHGPDDGIDIWLYAPSNNEQAIGIVQCKHWNAKTVGVAHVRELLGVMTAQRISRGQFVSSSGFSEDALAFAQANRIHTIDGARLLELIRQRGEAQQQALLEVALDGEYWKPTCATCGVKMVERTPSKGGRKFWGCAKYPKCRNRLGMRGG